MVSDFHTSWTYTDLIIHKIICIHTTMSYKDAAYAFKVIWRKTKEGHDVKTKHMHEYPQAVVKLPVSALGRWTGFDHIAYVLVL